MSFYTNKKQGITRIHQLTEGTRYCPPKGAIYSSGEVIKKDGTIEKIIFF